MGYVYKFLFSEREVSLISREKNGIADALAKDASTYRVLLYSKEKYEINMKYRPSIFDNTKHWQVFEDD